MSGKKDKYFNFPLEMLMNWSNGFEDKEDLLSDALCYHIYAYAIKIQETSEFDKSIVQCHIEAEKYYNVEFSDAVSSRIRNGKDVFNNYTDAKVFVGISREMYWEFREEEKTEFEWRCLIAFLALRSIAGNKKITKTDNAMMLARMSGKEKKKDYLPQFDIKLNRYQMDKIKNELQENWNMSYYARGVHGFFFSFTAELPELIRHVEIKKSENKRKRLIAEKERIRHEILAEIKFEIDNDIISTS